MIMTVAVSSTIIFMWMTMIIRSVSRWRKSVHCIGMELKRWLLLLLRVSGCGRRDRLEIVLLRIWDIEIERRHNRRWDGGGELTSMNYIRWLLLLKSRRRDRWRLNVGKAWYRYWRTWRNSGWYKVRWRWWVKRS